MKKASNLNALPKPVQLPHIKMLAKVDSAELYERYKSAMLRRAMSFVTEPADAEDIVSNCWLRLLTGKLNLRSDDERVLSAYIMRSVQNEAIDFLRRQQRNASRYVDSSVIETIPCSENALKHVLLRESVREIFSCLPVKCQRIVLLKVMGYHSAEIARMMQMHPTSMRVYMYRIRVKLKKALDLSAVSDDRLDMDSMLYQ